MGGENPLTIHEIYVALTPSDSRSDVGFRVCCRKLNRQRGVLYWKKSAFLKNKDAFLARNQCFRP